MEDFNTKQPLFKKIDRSVFEQIDKFKLSPNYAQVQDFYNGLDEEQQKLFKAGVNAVLVLLPLLILGVLWWQNYQLREDLEVRATIMQKAQEIIGQKQSMSNVAPQILSQNPIDSAAMMTSRLSGVLSASGVDTAKVNVSNFSSSSISSNVMRSEADVAFSNLTTDELVNLFTSLIQREKFRIESVDIRRSADTNLLTGQFHAIHFSLISAAEEE